MKDNNAFLPFAVPDIGEEEINEVVDSLRSGWVTSGPKVKEFENEFQQFLGSDLFCVSVNSATAGLHLALEALKIKEGDEVIVPSYTFTATAEIVRYFGAHPKIIDVDESTYNISIEQIQQAFSPKTKAIIPVHFAGLSCDMDPIIDFAKQNKISIVEDAAHALPTMYKNKIIGTLESDVTVYSFYANKNITTGEGGMVVTRDPEIAKRLKVMRLHGISTDAFDRFVAKKPSWHYQIIAPGYKYNLTDIAASIGIHQLRKLKDMHEKRIELAKRYDKYLDSNVLRLPPKQDYDSHAWHLYSIQLPKSKISRELFIEKLYELNIGCSVHYIPLHLHPYWKDTYRLDAINFPNSQKLYEGQVSLPLHTKLSYLQQDRIIESVNKIISSA